MSFPGLASIPPGGHVDVFVNWTPQVALTPAQILAGQFFLHSCIRLRLSRVPGETYFANQDGDGQQENIDYFDATGATPGAPGTPHKAVIHLRNDSPSQSKEFVLDVLRDTLPAAWSVTLNNNHPVVKLAPGALVDIPVEIKQSRMEPVGTQHQIRVISFSRFTFTSTTHPLPHDEARQLGGVMMQVNVLQKTSVTCKVQGGIVVGQVTGLDPRDQKLTTYLAFVPLTKAGPGYKLGDRLTLGTSDNGAGIVRIPVQGHGTGVCLFAGTSHSVPSGSVPFTM